jgi:cell division protein FtsB
MSREQRNKKEQRKSLAKDSRFMARWYMLVPLGLVIIIAISVPWYYDSATIWYRETRQERVLRETLAGIEDYNAALREELHSLETTEGVQDYARRELNLVVEGDRSIVVTRDGIPIREPRNTRAAVIAEIPENARPFGAWTDFLDSIFGIDD